MKVTDGPKNKGGARAPQPPQKRFPTLSIATKLPAAVNMDKSCVSYINAYSLIAETTRVPKSQFYGNEEKTYELTHAALNILKAKSDTSLEAWDRHEVVDGFRELVEKEFGFAAVHSWMDKKEAQIVGHGRLPGVVTLDRGNTCPASGAGRHAGRASLLSKPGHRK